MNAYENLLKTALERYKQAAGTKDLVSDFNNMALGCFIHDEESINIEFKDCPLELVRFFCKYNGRDKQPLNPDEDYFLISNDHSFFRTLKDSDIVDIYYDLLKEHNLLHHEEWKEMIVHYCSNEEIVKTYIENCASTKELVLFSDAYVKRINQEVDEPDRARNEFFFEIYDNLSDIQDKYDVTQFYDNEKDEISNSIQKLPVLKENEVYYFDDNGILGKHSLEEARNRILSGFNNHLDLFRSNCIETVKSSIYKYGIYDYDYMLDEILKKSSEKSEVNTVKTYQRR